MSPRLDQAGDLSVWVYFADHRRPHVQVRSPGAKANIDIRTGEVLAGHVPPKDLRLLRMWLEPRRDALESAFYASAFYAALRHEATDTILTRYREATREL